MRYSIKGIVVFTTLLIAASGCSQGDIAKGAKADAHTDINQSEICEVSVWQRDVTTEACKPGQKVVFLPQSWGNDQLPILFAAVNCDLRYSVALTNGGVTCIFNPIEPVAEKTEPAPKPEKP